MYMEELDKVAIARNTLEKVLEEHDQVSRKVLRTWLLVAIENAQGALNEVERAIEANRSEQKKWMTRQRWFLDRS